MAVKGERRVQGHCFTGRPIGASERADNSGLSPWLTERQATSGVKQLEQSAG